MIKLPWRRNAKPLKPRQNLNPRLMELETAKEVLAEIFHARPSNVEEMIQMRLEEKNWSKESWQEELARRGGATWPREFCLGEKLWVGASDQDFN